MIEATDAGFGAEFLAETEASQFGGLTQISVRNGGLVQREIYVTEDGQIVFGPWESYNPGGML